jgi:hypothetical protein
LKETATAFSLALDRGEELAPKAVFDIGPATPPAAQLG